MNSKCKHQIKSNSTFISKFTVPNTINVSIFCHIFLLNSNFKTFWFVYTAILPCFTNTFDEIHKEELCLVPPPSPSQKIKTSPHSQKIKAKSCDLIYLRTFRPHNIPRNRHWLASLRDYTNCVPPFRSFRGTQHWRNVPDKLYWIPYIYPPPSNLNPPLFFSNFIKILFDLRKGCKK